MTHPNPEAGARSRSLPADITVPNPDDPFGPPIYEGPSAEAGQHLVPGTYAAVHQADSDHIYEVVVDDHERAALFHTGTAPATITATPAGTTTGTVTPEVRAAATTGGDYAGDPDLYADGPGLGEWADAEAVAAEAVATERVPGLADQVSAAAAGLLRSRPPFLWTPEVLAAATTQIYLQHVAAPADVTGQHVEVMASQVHDLTRTLLDRVRTDVAPNVLPRIRAEHPDSNLNVNDLLYRIFQDIRNGEPEVQARATGEIGQLLRAAAQIIAQPDQVPHTLNRQVDRMRADLAALDNPALEVTDHIPSSAEPAVSASGTVDQPEADDPRPAPNRTGTREGIRLTVTGNLSTAPEYGYNQAGQAWIRLTVASAERYRDTGGNWRTGDTQFTPVLLFGRAAENLINADVPLVKGSRIEATGRPVVEPFTRADGTVSVELKVLARSIGRPDPEPKAPAPPPEPPGKRPTIHHNPDHTIATGVGRDDIAVRTALKTAGFTWSSPRKVWHLPASMPAAERQNRIEQATAKLADTGTGPAWDVTSDPAPGTAAAARATNTANLGAGQFTPQPFAPATRSGPSRS